MFALAPEADLCGQGALIARLIADNPGTSDAEARAAIYAHWMF
jgi:hypothetical protein